MGVHRSQLTRGGQVHEFEYILTKDEFEPYVYLICFSLSKALHGGGIHSIQISFNSVRIWWSDGSMTHTNLVPSGIYSGRRKLGKAQLCRIIDTLEDIGFEGKFHSRDEAVGLVGV